LKNKQQKISCSAEMRIYMEEQSRPLWMSDELVKDIPQKKLDFLSQMFAQSQEVFSKASGSRKNGSSGNMKSQKEIMMLLMPMMKKAKQEHLTFTPQEMQAAITAIKKYSTAEELRQIEKVLEKGKNAGTPQK